MPRRPAFTGLTKVRPGSPELQTIADTVSGAKRIVVIAGAGISTAAGLPDFRSPGGLYANGDVFEAAAFFDERRPRVLETALRLRDAAASCEPTKTHMWIKSLGHKLRRCYTQNIDMLEAKAGISTGLDQQCKGIPLHGSLANLECYLCHEAHEWEESRRDIEDGKILACRRCTDRCNTREQKGMRPIKIGQLRPSMVVLDEAHPHGEKIASIAKGDVRAHPDLLVVLGTSLKVDGPRKLFKHFARKIRSLGGNILYVNWTKPPSDCSAFINCWVQWDVDNWVKDLEGRQDQRGTSVRKRSVRRAPPKGGRILSVEERTLALPDFGNVGTPGEPLGSGGNPRVATLI